MRARRTDAPRKTAITMAVMAPGPRSPAHTQTHICVVLLIRAGYKEVVVCSRSVCKCLIYPPLWCPGRVWDGRSQGWRTVESSRPGKVFWWWRHWVVLQTWCQGCLWLLRQDLGLSLQNKKHSTYCWACRAASAHCFVKAVLHWKACGFANGSVWFAFWTLRPWGWKAAHVAPSVTALSIRTSLLEMNILSVKATGSCLSCFSWP